MQIEQAVSQRKEALSPDRGSAANRAYRSGGPIARVLAPHLSRGMQIAIAGLFVLAALFALDWGSYFIIPVTTAIIVGVTLGPVVDKMERAGLAPRFAGIVILAAITGTGYLLFLAFAIPLEEWSARIPEIATRLGQALFWVQDPIERLNALSQEVKQAAGQGDKLKVEVANQGYVTLALASAPAFLGQLMIFVGTFYFFTVGRKQVRSSVMALPATFTARMRIARTLRDVETSLSSYLLAITLINSAFGVLVGLVMWAMGLPVPALWGALAAVLNFIQFLGPALMAVILAGVALITFDTPSVALLPPLVFVGMNILEGQFITPALLGTRLVINPLIVFLSLAFWLWLWGPIGAFLAVPLLILAATVIYHQLPPGRREPFSLGRN